MNTHFHVQVLSGLPFYDEQGHGHWRDGLKVLRIMRMVFKGKWDL